MNLTDAAADAYRHMVRTATFYVVDTEYTRPATDDTVRASRLISIAIVPVVAGVKQTPLYVEMNPTVPVSSATQEITGFTTEKVAKKRSFAFYADRIVKFFQDPAGVFVSHTGADLRVLRGELEREDIAGNKVGLANLPDLAVIDTALLPRLLQVQGIPAAKGAVSLNSLCSLIGVNYREDKAHHARYDAKTTADALCALLGHAANSGRYVDLNSLLKDHSRGTTATPRSSGQYSSAPDDHPALPPAHISKHGLVVLTEDAEEEEIRAFTEMATECVALRCEYLKDETAGSVEVADKLLDPLWGLLPSCTEPGQAGTLFGAVSVLLPDAMPSTRMVRWWTAHKNEVAQATRCGGQRHDACPECRTSQSCPQDVLYTTVARVAALCGRAELTKKTVKEKLFSAPHKKDSRIRDWSRTHPELAGYMAWMVVEWERDNGAAIFAAKYLTAAVDRGLHRVEPRLGLLYADKLLRHGHVADARQVATDLLTAPTTDEAYVAVRLWLERLDQVEIAQQRRESDVAPTRKPRIVRPRNRVNPNPYRITVPHA